MLVIALVLALIGLVALVFAVVTSNELVAWVCIAASVVGVVLLIVDALRERQRRDAGAVVADEDEAVHDEDEADAYVDYPEDAPGEAEDENHPEGHAEDDAEGQPEATAQSAVASEGHGDEAAK